MRDLRRLLKYLLPQTGTFIAANFAMIVVGLMDGATTVLLIPIMNQVFGQGSGQRATTLFAWQKIIPASGLAAWRMIALLLITFTVIKGIAEYLSTYWMAYIGQSAILRLRQELYGHLLAQSASFFERHRTNYLVSRLISSAAAIETAVTILCAMRCESFTLIVFIAAAFFYVNWRLWDR
jgi:ABC-type multidrug transport system fused ATPase/permease subunit